MSPKPARWRPVNAREGGRLARRSRSVKRKRVQRRVLEEVLAEREEEERTSSTSMQVRKRRFASIMVTCEENWAISSGKIVFGR